MKALSLYQPYATLVVLGLKRFETRSWPCPLSAGDRFAVHATREPTAMTYAAMRDGEIRAALAPFGIDGVFDLPYGAILGTVQYVRQYATNRLTIRLERGALIEETRGRLWGTGLPDADLSPLELRAGDYTPDRYAWQLVAPVKLRASVAARGSQKLWEMPAILETYVSQRARQGTAYPSRR